MIRASLGRLERVAEALAANLDVNIRGVGGYTAMHVAAENGQSLPSSRGVPLDKFAVETP